jgi:hypothetical protein
MITATAKKSTKVELSIANMPSERGSTLKNNQLVFNYISIYGY